MGDFEPTQEGSILPAQKEVGLDKAGETADWFYLSEEWYLLRIVGGQGSGVIFDAETLLHPAVANKYSANVMIDLIERGTLRDTLGPKTEQGLNKFVQELELKLAQEGATLTPEKREFTEAVGALANYVLAQHEFEGKKTVPKDRYFGLRKAYFSPFSIPEMTSELLEKNIPRNDIPKAMSILTTFIEYASSELLPKEKQGIVKACERTKEVFNQKTIGLNDILSIHSELVLNNPRGGKVDHNLNILRRVDSRNLDNELVRFMGRLNNELSRITPQTSPDMVFETAVELMEDWTKIHPTYDASGRLSRIIGDAILMRGGQPLIPITLPNKWEHRSAISESENKPEILKEYWRKIMLPKVRTWANLISYEKGELH